MAFCPSCGAQVAPGTRFCPNCGAPQGQQGYGPQRPPQQHYPQQAFQPPQPPVPQKKKSGMTFGKIILIAIIAAGLAVLMQIFPLS